MFSIMVLNPVFRNTIPTQPFVECTYKLFEHLDQAIISADAVNIPILMRRLTLDALGKTLFRFNFNALQNPENRYYKCYEGTFEGFANPVRILFPRADPIISLFDKHAVQSFADLNEVVFDIIEKRKKEIQDGIYKDEGDQHKDMLRLMIEAEAESGDDENRWTTTDIKDNLMVFFLAGHDTTQASLSVAIYYLALIPEIQELARQEINSIFTATGSLQIPSIKNCRNMKYIDCIIREVHANSWNQSNLTELPFPRALTCLQTYVPCKIPLSTGKIQKDSGRRDSTLRIIHLEMPS
ncbi:uncharacterized protein VTP21DRAFT_4765 [Calcarisporiella thermophila]|uniref:uncharacterized protein n=1 Tax=Calcarisporiella thermophila TaxID=911321 RepID=UPI0037427F52